MILSFIGLRKGGRNETLSSRCDGRVSVFILL